MILLMDPQADESLKQRALVKMTNADKSMFNIFPAIKRPGLPRL